MRRRGKGEASFLHCKSLGRGDVMNRGRRMKGEKEAKRDKREEREIRGGFQTEVG